MKTVRFTSVYKVISLFPNQNKNAGDQRDYSGYITNTEAGECNDPDADEVNRQEKHTDVFCDHGRSILTGLSHCNSKGPSASPSSLPKMMSRYHNVFKYSIRAAFSCGARLVP